MLFAKPRRIARILCEMRFKTLSRSFQQKQKKNIKLRKLIRQLALYWPSSRIYVKKRERERNKIEDKKR